MGITRQYIMTPEDRDAWDAKSTIERQQIADVEYVEFIKERETLAKVIDDAQNGLGTLLVTISTVAIGASLTIFKDVVDGPTFALKASWVAFVACLIGSLLDRVLAYVSNQQFLATIDEVFTSDEFHGHAFKEIGKRLELLKLPKYFSWLKFANIIFVIAGVIALILFVADGVAKKANDKVSPPPAIVLQPATQPIVINLRIDSNHDVISATKGNVNVEVRQSRQGPATTQADAGTN